MDRKVKKSEENIKAIDYYKKRNTVLINDTFKLNNLIKKFVLHLN